MSASLTHGIGSAVRGLVTIGLLSILVAFSGRAADTAELATKRLQLYRAPEPPISR